MTIIAGHRRILLAIAEYDFDLDGGAVGARNLRGRAIPDRAVITDALLVVHTALAGGTATDSIGLGSEALNDLQGAVARNAATWATTGARRISLNATGAPISTTAERRVRMQINGTALTAGRFTVIVHYIPQIA